MGFTNSGFTGNSCSLSNIGMYVNIQHRALTAIAYKEPIRLQSIHMSIPGIKEKIGTKWTRKLKK